MAYHITLVANNSDSSIAITNPANENDSRLVGPNTNYKPNRPILINKMSGNPTYSGAISVANNIYTFADNFCFWDNEHDAVNGIGEKGGTILFNSTAGDLTITIKADGTLSFARAASAAKAG
jgi:hypothetical protein